MAGRMSLMNANPAIRYSMAVVSVIVAVVLTEVFRSLVGMFTPLAFFYAASVLAALLAGAGPGYLTVALTVPAGFLLIIADPASGIELFSARNIARLGLFTSLSVLSCFVCGALHRSRRELLEQFEAAQRSEARFQVLFEASPIGISIIRNEQVIYANRRYAEMFGYPDAEVLIGRPLTDMFAEKWRPFIAERNRRRLEGHLQSDEYEVEGLRSDGSTFPFRVSVSHIHLSDGPATLAFFIDTSQQHRYEQALRENQERLQAALAAAHMGTWRYDFRTGIEIRGPSLNKLLGLDPVPSGQPFKEFFERIHPEDQPAVKNAIRASVDEDKPYDIEFRIRRADGAIRWMRDRGALVRDEDGQPLYMTGAMVDMTVLREAQQALQQRERELEQIVENLPSIIARLDRDMRCLFVNRSIGTATGRRPEHYIGRTFTEAGVDPQLAQPLIDTARQVFQTGQPCEAEIDYPAPDRRRVYQLRIVPEWNEDQDNDTVLCIAHDITRLKAAEAELNRAIQQEQEARRHAEAASRAKDQFLAVLSHELRTPLTPVLLTLAAMETEDLSDSLREDLAMIRRNVELETKLIDDLLDVTRIINGKLRLQLARINVHCLIEHVRDILQSDADARRLRIELDLQAKDDAVNADPARLQQVFWNLLKNAIKFSYEGGRIVVRSRLDSSRSLCVEVIDEGVGIEPEAMPRLFQAFEQGSARVTQQFGGLGLGLAISRAITELHGGTITAASEGVGKGACFTVTLPIVAPVQRLLNRIDAGQQRRGDGVRVLLVEDHPDTGQMLQRYLSAEGFEVKLAGSVAAALQLADEQPFDIVISDIGLPDASGLDLMRRLRERCTLPGIAISGYGMETDVRNSREAGFFTHLTKPIDPSRLGSLIHQAINESTVESWQTAETRAT